MTHLLSIIVRPTFHGTASPSAISGVKSEANLLSVRAGCNFTPALCSQVLLLKINATKSCAGVSLKTQELYLLVFVTRYLDLFYSFISL